MTSQGWWDNGARVCPRGAGTLQNLNLFPAAKDRESSCISLPSTRSTLGLSLTCPMSPKAAGSRTGCRDRGHGASVPRECPAEHVLGQPPVRNEERPLFTVKRNKKPKKYIKYRDPSRLPSPSARCLPPPRSHHPCPQDGADNSWGSFVTHRARDTRGTCGDSSVTARAAGEAPPREGTGCGYCTWPPG